MKVNVKQIEGMTFLGKTGSGHGVVIDAAEDLGGQNLGARPMELLLLGMGGCSSIDVVHIMKKSRLNVDDVSVEVEAERAETDPKVFTKINMHFVVKGKDLDPKKVERAIALSAEKYCSASIMLGQVAEVTHDFEIIDV